MSLKTIAAQVVAVGIPVSNEVTNDGIITTLELEQMVFAGMTYGAWFKIIAGISILSVIAVNVIKIVSTLRRGYKKKNNAQNNKKKKG